MPTQTVTALFDRYAAAADAVGRLEAAGVPHADIGLLSNDAAHRREGGLGEDRLGLGDPILADEGHVSGTGAGASLGTVIGGGAGLLAGLGLLAIPGFGPVLAAGWLTTALVGAGIGAAAGGLVGSLTDIGVHEPDAHAYAEGLHRGGTLLTVKAEPAMAERIAALLDQDDAVHLLERQDDWRAAGWTGFHAAAADRGNPAVTGPQVFSDPTMLGLAGTAAAGGATTDTLPAIRQDDVRRAGAGRGRVRIYDNG